MGFLKRNLLPIAVFLTGASILVIEVAAVRILSPWYGNTIFTVSGVITVILLALSVGYYAGGVMADRRPSLRRFFGIILASGVVLLATCVLGARILPWLSAALPMTSGPLAASALLFLLPALLLGMLSPYAVKLQCDAVPEQGVGHAAGRIFFWSTLGSIGGSLAAGFVLIPRLGIDSILIAVATFLSLLGLIPLTAMRIREGKKHPYRLMAAVALAALALSAFWPAKGMALYLKDGVYERLAVFDGVQDGRPTRFFRQDMTTSGAMRLDSEDPSDLVYAYTRTYGLYAAYAKDVRRALVIGGGAYSIPKALAAERPEAVIDVAEIEPSLPDLAREHFRVPETPRLRSRIEDGRRLLRGSDERYDLIFSDVYSSVFSVPPHFTTREFFALAKERLSDDGLFIANMIGDLSRRQPSLIMAEIKTFRSVFPNSRFFAMESPGFSGAQNIILVGVNGGAQAVRTSADPFLASLDAREIDLRRFELSPYPTLTDAYAPVEALTAHVLRRAVEGARVIDGEEMLAVVEQQLRYGPRHLSAPGHARMQEFLIAEMRALTPDVRVQAWERTGSDGRTTALKNVIARFAPERERRIILATHYDSKRYADMDAKDPDRPVPGANDSGSGVAVLVETARALSRYADLPHVGVDIVFFDGEEGDEDLRGTFAGWEALGSTHFAERLEEAYGEAKPIGAVVFDMVCDKRLRFPKEPNSMREAPAQVEAFWDVARLSGGKAFEDRVGQGIDDDHMPLNRAGVSSILVIDYEYPHFHTTEDTPDKCAADSLEQVAQAAYAYVESLQEPRAP